MLLPPRSMLENRFGALVISAEMFELYCSFFEKKNQCLGYSLSQGKYGTEQMVQMWGYDPTKCFCHS
jgi:hypothetical protein